MNALDWIREFRHLSGVGLHDAKGAWDKSCGMTPAEMWASCGGKVPRTIGSLQSENDTLRYDLAEMKKEITALWEAVRKLQGGQS